MKQIKVFGDKKVRSLWDTTSGNDLKSDGSKLKPFETISKALSIILADKNNTLHIGSGLFRIKKQIIVPSGVNLLRW